MTCTVRAFDEPREFAVVVEPLVRADPAGTTVLATVLSDVLSGSRSYPAATWLVVEDAGQVVGAGMQTPPHRLWLSPMPEDGAVAVAGLMAERLPPAGLPGIAGERVAVGAAARCWKHLRPHEPVAEVRAMRLFTLDTLRPPADVPGQARVATMDDIAVVTEWYRAFAAEVATQIHDLDSAVAARLNGHGAVLLWEREGLPVSLAGRSAEVAGTARVGPVYTPPEQRTQGYGGAVTAATSQHALDAGIGQVVLFTDLANPTSNSLYQRLGYRPVRDYVELDAG